MLLKVIRRENAYIVMSCIYQFVVYIICLQDQLSVRTYINTVLIKHSHVICISNTIYKK